MRKAVRGALYCGLVPIIILMAAALLPVNGGPFSMPGNFSQSPPQFGRALAIPTALSESTRKFAAWSISELEASFTTTAIPITAPPPVQFHEAVFQPLISKNLKIICPIPIGSGVSPMIQMSACVPEYFEASSIKWRACASVIVRGALNCASCACASSARAFASAIAALEASASEERRAISLLAAASLTLPETTIPYVATTPITSAPINIQLDQNEINSAHGSDIEIPKAFLFLFPGVAAVALGGVSIMILLLRFRPPRP